MKIDFFLRNRAAGYSLERVARPYMEMIEKGHDAKIFMMPKGGSNPRDVIANILYARKVHRPGALIHLTGDCHYLLYVFPRHSMIVTVHDIAGVYAYAGNKLDWLYYKLLFVKSLTRAAKVVCISEFTRQEILKHSTVSPERLIVIGNPLPCGIERREKPFNAEHPLILISGSTPNKNLDRLIAAVRNSCFRLRVIARVTPEQCRELENAGIEYSIASGLSDAEMFEEYKKADIVFAASYFEGFGVPIIEAQAVGRALLTSNIEPMCGVAGAGGLKVDPYDVQAIRSGLEQLRTDTALREQLIAEGFRNVQRFTPENIARQYCTLYEKILKSISESVCFMNFEIDRSGKGVLPFLVRRTCYVLNLLRIFFRAIFLKFSGKKIPTPATFKKIVPVQQVLSFSRFPDGFADAGQPKVVLYNSHSLNNQAIFEATWFNHSRYCELHNYHTINIIEPYRMTCNVKAIAWLLEQYDLVVTIGSDILFTAPEKKLEQFAVGDISLCREPTGILNGDFILFKKTPATFEVLHYLDALQTGVRCGQTTLTMLEKAFPNTIVNSPDLQRADPAMNPDYEGKTWKPGDFSIHFLRYSKSSGNTSKIEHIQKFREMHKEFF